MPGERLVIVLLGTYHPTASCSWFGETNGPNVCVVYMYVCVVVVQRLGDSYQPYAACGGACVSRCKEHNQPHVFLCERVTLVRVRALCRCVY